MSEPQSALLLRKQLAELNKNPVEGFSAGLIDDNDIYRWEVLIIGPPDTLYEGGFFKAHLQFPKEYPLRPPRMKFITEIWHPNIEKNGDVCISILHEPGDDKWGYEKASERWLPVHTVETILISVISMLADPNDESPANVDAAVKRMEGMLHGVQAKGGKVRSKKPRRMFVGEDRLFERKDLFNSDKFSYKVLVSITMGIIINVILCVQGTMIRKISITLEHAFLEFWELRTVGHKTTRIMQLLDNSATEHGIKETWLRHIAKLC